jgi:RNA polymerase sigma-70 factor (ECF subfamily)
MRVPGSLNPAQAGRHTPLTPVSDEQEAALIRRIGARDRDALAVLYTIYHRRLARFLGRFIRQYDVVQEIVNDTLFIVWQQADRFRGGSRVSTWIMGIAYRRALRSLRQASARPAVQALAEDAAEVVDELETEEQRELLARALESLPLEQRMVLELTYYLGHSCEEIAAIVDCPVNTVKTRMFHARRKLRALLPVLSGGEGA